jgi:hypothetical protein
MDMDERHVESVDFAHLVLVVWNMLLKRIVRGACGGPANFSMQHTGVNAQMCETF